MPAPILGALLAGGLIVSTAVALWFARQIGWLQ